MNLDAYNLIAKLNLVIRGWSNYYNIGNSSHHRNKLRNLIYHMVWKWAHIKHTRWGKKLVAKTYFLIKLTEIKNDNLYKIKYVKHKNVKWTFHGKTNSLSRYNNNNTKRIFLVDVTNVTKAVSSRNYLLLTEIKKIHGYHEDIQKIIEWNLNANFKSLGEFASFKQKLLVKQKGLCTQCNKLITTFDIDNNRVHLHHIKLISKKGSRNNITNMNLVHSWCHKDIHKTK